MQTQYYCYGCSINTTEIPVIKVNVTDFPVVKVHVDELSSARIWQHKLCATLSAKVNINYHLPIKVYYRICNVRHIRIEIILASMIYFLNKADTYLFNSNLYSPPIKYCVNGHVLDTHCTAAFIKHVFPRLFKPVAPLCVGTEIKIN
jgi:hypothetical protein